MRPARMRPPAVLIASLVLATPVLGQRTPAAWSDYDLIQFITTGQGSPSSILGLDDNGSLVLTASGGVDEEDFARRTGATDSQRQLLVTWRLLERHGDTLRTSFPIFDEAATRDLRARTLQAALELSAAIAPDVKTLRQELSRRGRSANAYSIMFSYVLDGLTWDLWEAAGAIPPRELSIEHPFWDGEIWAVTPKRAGLVGTNRISDERGALNVNWSYAALPSMKAFVQDFASLGALFEAFAERSDTVPAEVRGVFEPYGLFGEDGSLMIPIIEEHAGDRLYDLALRIATILTDAAPRALDVAALRRDLGLRSDAQALIVGYHELMWDVLAALEEGGLIRRPTVLDGHGQPADVAALVFGVR